MVIEKGAHGERAFDIFSRLLKERIIMISGEIDDTVSSLIIAQMLFLESESSDKDIHLYVDSVGGEVAAGLAIYDTMQYIKPDISTICMGLAASMGALLLAAGVKGKRYCLPHARVLIHQPMGGISGQAADIAIHANEILKVRESINRILSDHTGKSMKEIGKDTDRNFWMSPEEAVKYGIVDKILRRREELTK
jgi:ATP-dependent Clp protease protease subunit